MNEPLTPESPYRATPIRGRVLHDYLLAEWDDGVLFLSALFGPTFDYPAYRPRQDGEPKKLSFAAKLAVMTERYGSPRLREAAVWDNL